MIIAISYTLHHFVNDHIEIIILMNMPIAKHIAEICFNVN